MRSYVFLYNFTCMYVCMYVYIRIIGYLRVKECLAGLELPEGARNTRKATVKIQRNPQLPLTQIYIYLQLLAYKHFKYTSLKKIRSERF